MSADLDGSLLPEGFGIVDAVLEDLSNVTCGRNVRLPPPGNCDVLVAMVTPAVRLAKAMLDESNPAKVSRDPGTLGERGMLVPPGLEAIASHLNIHFERIALCCDGGVTAVRTGCALIHELRTSARALGPPPEQ